MGELEDKKHSREKQNAEDRHQEGQKNGSHFLTS